ncbi:ArsC family reductase [Alteromonadaceae bacterium BrNp21-10]|nr:ArsC family reductase [Alteromonadaceae bacterium BrNp21-10]
MTTLFGIKNCDTIKKARKWLESEQIDYRFHDYRTDGLDAEWLKQCVQHLDWQNLLNTRGTTYRQLSDDQKADMNQEKAIALMLEMPAMIKRPVLIHNDEYFLGFKADTYKAIFA